MRYLMFILLLTVLAGPAAAKQKKLLPPVATNPPGSFAEYAFNAAERHLIRSGLTRHANQMTSSARPGPPPGLDKKTGRGKELPPGWQKKVVPGKRLDFEVFRSGRSLPTGILERLPPPLAGTEIIRVEDTILRIRTESRIVLDMFDLFRN